MTSCQFYYLAGVRNLQKQHLNKKVAGRIVLKTYSAFQSHFQNRTLPYLDLPQVDLMYDKQTE